MAPRKAVPPLGHDVLASVVETCIYIYIYICVCMYVSHLSPCLDGGHGQDGAADGHERDPRDARECFRLRSLRAFRGRREEAHVRTDRDDQGQHRGDGTQGETSMDEGLHAVREPCPQGQAAPQHNVQWGGVRREQPTLPRCPAQAPDQRRPAGEQTQGANAGHRELPEAGRAHANQMMDQREGKELLVLI